MKISGPPGPSPAIQRSTFLSRSSATNNLIARYARNKTIAIGRLPLKSRRNPRRGAGAALKLGESSNALSALAGIQQFRGGARYLQLFVHRNHPHFDAGVRRTD